jgi:hypothetical protein
MYRATETQAVLNQAQHLEDLQGGEGVTLCITNLGIRWKGVVSFTIRQLYSRYQGG